MAVHGIDKTSTAMKRKYGVSLVEFRDRIFTNPPPLAGDPLVVDAYDVDIRPGADAIYPLPPGHVADAYAGMSMV